MATAAILARHGITLPMDRITEFCRRWRIRELAVFGSFLREDFGPESDIDFLIDPVGGTRWAFEDLEAMEREMSGLLGRRAELVERSSVERSRNYIRRKHIIATAEPIYVQR